MNKASKNSIENGNIKHYIFGIIISFLTIAVMLALFSFIFLFTELDRAYSSAFATVAAAVGTLIGSYFTSYKIGTKGFKTGLIISLCIFFIITIISFAINKNGFSLNTLFHFIILLLSGFIGGVLGVNKNSRKKYI